MANEITTVRELYQLCQQAIREGLADKKILISNDDEGNYYHGLYFGFTTPEKYGEMDPYALPYGIDQEAFKSNCIILG